MLLNLSSGRRFDRSRYDARIHAESQFRRPNITSQGAPLPQGVMVSRWAGCSKSPEKHSVEILDDYHTIGVAMARAQLRVLVSDKSVFEGTVEPGTVQINSPGQPLSFETRGPYDWIHMHVGNDLLRSCQALLRPRERAASLTLRHEEPFVDVIIYDLTKSLVDMCDPPTPVSSLCGESILLAIFGRILGRRAESPLSEGGPKTNALIAWRLKRVKEFVAAHLADPITLADLGKVAGLSRMHFAAQFRAATTLRPHDYILQQRIQRAKELLLDTDMKLVDVSYAVGFQTQAHFTTVFRRIVHATPHQWRCRERAPKEAYCVAITRRLPIGGRAIFPAAAASISMLDQAHRPIATT